MSTSLLFAHPRMVAWRNRMRKSALIRGIYGSLVGRGEYEERFSNALLDAVRSDDTVWDIGANVGLYAARFAERGAAKVVCFEPAPAAVEALRRAFPDTDGRLNRIRIIPVALGNRRGTVRFSAEGTSPNNKIGAGNGSSAAIEIEMRSGDEALTEFALPPPDVIKIDVEGYEQEVIEGLAGILSQGAVRSVFVEVHFSLLHERGLDRAPAAILRILRQHGFDVSWVDPSHIGANRRRKQ
jgi:FkbM family methyltransferase